MRHPKNKAVGGVKRVDTKYTQFVAREEMGLLDFVMKKLDGISRSKAKSILSGGGVLVEHEVVTQFDFKVQPEMIVEISKHPGGSRARFDYTPFFDVVYEDDDVIVVNKADEVLSMGVGRNSLNMKDLLDRYFVETRQRCTAHVVHRLDARTTGLMMYAKSVEVQQMLTADWKKTIIDRRYVAVVEGEMEQDEGHVKSWLKDTDSMKRISSRTNNGGKWAWTDGRLLKKHNGLSQVELHLHTGRKNQIRVHSADMGHPVCGDVKYGNGDDPLHRLCLHAYVLCFTHPVTHERMEFETLIPAGFRHLFK